MGPLYVSPPLKRTSVTLDAKGQASLSQSLPPSTSGLTLTTHGLDLSSETLSNPLQVLVF